MSPLTQYLTDEEIVKAWVNKSDRPRKLIEIAKQARAAGFREGVEKAIEKIELVRPTIGEQTLASSKPGYSELYVLLKIDKTLKAVLRSLRDDEG